MEKEFLIAPMQDGGAACQMEYQKDCLDQEVLLKNGKYQVMMEWEKPYMEACIDALEPRGDVLEIGFGCGYSATRIQKFHPKSHTIIEYHPLVAEKAREWAKNYKNVIIIEDTWQHALAALGEYDSIFFDDYPLESEEEMQQYEEHVKTSSSLLKEGAELLEQVDQELPFLNTLQYTKEDMEQFLKTVKVESGVGMQVYRFFGELKQRGQITSALYHQMLDEIQQRGWISAKELNELAEKQTVQFHKERLMQFLEICLAKHMRKNARFSCFLSDPNATWENQRFFNEIILNPHLEYREKQIPIVVPEHCAYYKSDKALVITIEKMQ